MDIDVYDTYVRTPEGDVLHFDVLLQTGEGSKATLYARDWLQSIGRIPEGVSLEACRFCHTEAASIEVQQQIKEHGYFIIQMEGCPAPVC